jgi:hypothetical protein
MGAAVPDRGGGRAICRVKLLSDALNDVPRMRTRAAGVLARLRLDMQRGAGRPREAGEACRDSLGELIRGHQRDTDAFDEAVAERLGVNRTDLRCLDVLVEGPGRDGSSPRRSWLRPASSAHRRSRPCWTAWIFGNKR